MVSAHLCLRAIAVLPAFRAIFHLHAKNGNRNKAKSRLKFLMDQWGIETFLSVFDREFEEKGRNSLPKPFIIVVQEPKGPSSGGDGQERGLPCGHLAPSTIILTSYRGTICVEDLLASSWFGVDLLSL